MNLTTDDIERIAETTGTGQATTTKIVEELARDVARASGVPLGVLLGETPGRKGRYVALRRIVMWRANAMGCRPTHIARAMGMHHTTVLDHLRKEAQARADRALIAEGGAFRSIRVQKCTDDTARPGQ